MTATAAKGLDFDQMPTLGDIARYHARVRPEAVALRFEGRETRFSAFDRHASQVANALLAAGVRKGDRVAYVGKNSDHYFELLFGAAKMGAVVTPIGWRLAAPEIAYILRDSGAPMVFVGPEVAAAAQAAAAEAGTGATLVLMEPVEGVAAPLFEAWRDAAADTDPQTAIAPERDVAVQLYTSGTTGRPKGAMLSHANLLSGRRAAAEANMPWNEWGTEDVSLVAMPVAHIGGTGWGIVGLYNGALGVVAREVDYSRLKYILYGASPIPLDLLRECMEVFGCGFCQQYGMTETCGTIVYLPPEDHHPDGTPRMRGAGRPLPGVELKIIDGNGQTLPPGVVGEVATRSVANMVGYWRLDEATASTVGPDGWLRTGDAGYLDEDGYLYIHDRVKDMIISGAENIYPAEVESAIYGHPAVAEVAVVGVPDDKWGEAVKAMVVLKPGAEADPAGIIAFARTRIAAFKAPKSIDFIEALPRNASGKILRRELRAPYWEGRDRQVN